MLDAAYKSLTGRPPLVRISEANLDTEEAEAVKKLQAIYNSLNSDGELPEIKSLSVDLKDKIPNKAGELLQPLLPKDNDPELTALDSIIAAHAEKPSFADVLERRIMKSGGIEGGIDSPDEAALKAIAKRFRKEKTKGEKTQVTDSKTASAKDERSFFARREPHKIIQKLKDQYPEQGDKDELDKLDRVLTKYIDLHFPKAANEETGRDRSSSNSMNRQ